MNIPPEKSKLDSLDSSLYSRTKEPRAIRRGVLHDEENSIRGDWDHPEEREEPVRLNDHYESGGMSFFTKMLLGAIVFFMIALGLGAYVLFQGSNIVSANNVDITVSGPVSVSGGDVFQFEVQVYNKNSIKLELVDLSLEYPSGTVDPSNTSLEMKAFRELLPDIEPGSFSQKSLKAVLYGEENTKKDIKIKAEYRVKGSNAIFFKETTYSVFVNSSPLALTVSSFNEIQSDQMLELTVTLTSNSKNPLKNMLLKASYPFGFTYASSDVRPTYDTTLWKIDNLEPGAKKVIKIRGKMEGQDDENRIFKFAVGVQNPKNERLLGAEFAAKEQLVQIKKPFLSVQVALNGSSAGKEITAGFDTPIRGEVIWFNNLPTAILDAEIRLKFDGSAFDKTTVNPDEGFYNSPNNEIVWDKKTIKALGAIGAGESGRVTFNFIPRDRASKPLTNPFINLDVSVKAGRTSEQNVSESIKSTASRVVKIAPIVSLGSNLTRATAPFEQTGSIPPKAEQVTTYTVVWTVFNTSSNISNAKVESSLPPYVKFLNKISPAGSAEQLDYNPTDGKLVWTVGSVPAYSTNGANKKEIMFQIGFQPSVNQIGQSPDIVMPAELTAVDDFTGTAIKVGRPKLTPKVTIDSDFETGDDKVTD